MAGRILKLLKLEDILCDGVKRTLLEIVYIDYRNTAMLTDYHSLALVSVIEIFIRTLFCLLG